MVDEDEKERGIGRGAAEMVCCVRTCCLSERERSSQTGRYAGVCIWERGAVFVYSWTVEGEGGGERERQYPCFFENHPEQVLGFIYRAVE